VTTTAYAVQGQPEVRKLRDLVPQDADRLELTLRLAARTALARARHRRRRLELRAGR